MNPPQGIKGRQILKLLLNHLQTGVEDDQTFKIAELTSLKCRQTGHSDDEARLRSYLSTFISGIRKKIDDGVLLAVFIENVRHLRCMRPDIERWDRDVTVRSFAWLYKACQDCVERWQKRQNTLQMYQTFHEQRSRSGSQSRERDWHPGAPGVVRRYDPLARKSDPSPSRSVRSGRDGKADGKPGSSSPGRSSQRDRASPGRGSQRDKRTPSPKSPRRQSPVGPADRSCWEYAKTGKCQHGRDCRFEHDKSPRNPAAPSTPRTGDRPVRDKPMYFGYCYDWMYGKCTAQPCKYLHQKPPPGTKPITPRTTAGPVVEDEEGDTPRSPAPSPPDREARRLDSPAGLDAVGNWVRDDRHHDAPNHRHFTRGFWTGVTILFDKGCAPHGRFKPKEEGAEPAGGPKKGHKLHGDRIDYGQSADRRERPYAGTGKPNSIDADSWRQMSTRSREIYVQTERELSLREERRREHPERDPAAPAPGRKLWRRCNSRSRWFI